VTKPAVTPSELVARLGGVLRGDGDTPLSGVGTLAAAGPQDLSFLANARYRRHLAGTRAGCVVLVEDDLPQCPGTAIVTDDPYAYYARAAALIVPKPQVRPGVHPDASVHPQARIDAAAWIGPGAVVGAGAEIDGRVFVGPGCVIGDNVRIGEDTRLEASVTVIAAARIGRRCILHPGVVVGGDGFGVAWSGSGWIKVPQLGSVAIGDDVEIGSNTAIDRGAIDDTVIGEGVKLDNLIQIGHNVRIGANTVVAGCTGISGSTTVGSHCLIGGQVGIAGHLTIADGAVITGKTLVNHSIKEAGRYSGALPMDESGRWRRNSARFRGLDELARRIIRLERGSRDKKS